VRGAEWLATLPGIRPDEPLARHSQFGVGGPAQWFLKTADASLIEKAVRQCAGSGVPLTMLGAGSNALILDSGVAGLVLRDDDRHMRRVDDATIEVGAGAMMPRVALDCARRGWTGLEFGIGVPGTAGASVYGNAGAFGTEVADVLVDCTILDAGGATRLLGNAECGFAYRDSRLKSDLRGSVVVKARFRVSAADPAVARARTDAVQAQRKASQPYGVRSLGSVFKNPTGDHAGRLIEAAGLKGARSGGAEISPKHANFIVNRDHATAADVLALVALAHGRVQEQFGVDLEREIVVLG
jgi:UDP-N-acetylmuramate dehydrogenase